MRHPNLPIRQAGLELLKLFMFLMALAATGLFRPSGLDWPLAIAVAVAFALILSPMYRAHASSDSRGSSARAEAAADRDSGEARRISRGKLYGAALAWAAGLWLVLHLATTARQARTGDVGFEAGSVWVVLAFVAMALAVAGTLDRARRRDP